MTILILSKHPLDITFFIDAWFSVVLSCSFLQVRGICVCGDAGIATSSRDGTVKFWRQNPEKKSEYVLSKTLAGHSSFVGPLAWIPPSDRFSEGGIVSGGMDTFVFLWDLHKGEVVERMKGHNSQVTGLAVDTNGDIISSSMDW